MPDDVKNEDSITAYRDYYIKYKRRFCYMENEYTRMVCREYNECQHIDLKTTTQVKYGKI